MSDVNANIGVHIDTSAALAELKNLQRQIATFHSQISKSSATAAMAQKNLQTNLLNAINATGKFHAQMGVVRTSTESFTNALEKNKLSMREYFRYAGGASKSFGKLFRQEFDTIGKVAEERVKKMQTQYIKMGRDASGAMRAMSITPNTLNMQDYATKTALAAQRQALFNQLVKQGSTNLLNFGKNTQWAGRQLMVGFSIPLLYVGSTAAKVFMDLEQQALKFKRVYGDMFTTSDETNKALKDVELLAQEFTKYGVAVSKTMEMAASAAAMGKTGAELTAQVAQATRLAVLGNVEQEQALETTTSLTNAFGIAAEDLAKKIDFLNSVENQTVVSIEDLTIAIPKAGPVVKQLGGDVEDLAFFLTAMKEGGINASEGANALKSGLASLINPSKKAAAMLNDYGVNIKGIVEGNQGDIKNTVIEFAQALDTLAPLDRSRAIEQLFGKFQFARLSTLFQNITKEGTQANRVLELSKMEVEELAILSERELKTIENAVGTNFKAAVESLKLTIAPIGKTFLEAVTPIVKAVAGLLEKFNNLGDGTKKFIVIASTLVGIIGPTLLMTFGLVANGAANIIKLFLAMRTGFLKLGGNTKILAEQTSYMNSEQLEAATVASSLNQSHTRLTQTFALEASAVKALRDAYVSATVASTNFARANPGMMMPGPAGKAAKKFGKGTTYVPGTGNKDTVPSVLTPGEAVIPAPIAQDPRFQPIIDAMVNGKLQGFNSGTGNAMPEGKQSSKQSIKQVNSEVAFSHVTGDISGRAEKRTIQQLYDSGDFKGSDQKVLKSYVDAGMGKLPASAYSSLGFDIPKELNAKLAGDPGASKDAYIKAISRPGAINTMVQTLMQQGMSQGEAIRTAHAFRKGYKQEISSLGPVIKDADLVSTTKTMLASGKYGNILPLSNLNVTQRPSSGDIGKFLSSNATASETLNYNDAKKILEKENLSVGKKLGPDFEKNKSNITIFRDSSGKVIGVEARDPNNKLTHRGANLPGMGLDMVRTKGGGRFGGYASLSSRVKKTSELGSVLTATQRKKMQSFYEKAIVAKGAPTDKQSVRDINEKEEKALKQIAADAKNTKSGKLKATDFGKLMSPTSGFSFPVRNIGGKYQKPDGTNVFVKPMMDEKAALAEMRATKIAREVHGLDAPEQKIKTMIDPTDPTGKRKIIVLESAFNPKFDPTKMTNTFTKDEFFKQSVAAMLRADKDLGRGNLSGNVLADVGPAGVFGSASGKRDYILNLPSMEEQGRINLDLNTPNKNRKKFFAEATSDIARSMTAEQYDKAMKAEIDKVLPKLKETVKNFNLDPSEKPIYDAMIKRLEDGRKVNWQKLHKSHVAVPASKLVVAKGEDYQTSEGKQKTVTGQTGKAKGSGRNITDSPRDTRVIDKKSVRRVFPYGMKGMRVAGAIDGFDGTKTKGGLGFNRGLGTTTQDILKQSRVQESALKENIAATKDETAASKAATAETKENAKQTKLSKENIKSFGAKANIGVGALSGLTIAASFAGGKVGEMAQKIMPFIFGLQGILMLLPLLMNPLVGLPLAIGAVVAGIWLFKKKQDDAIKAEARLVDELYATTKKMQQVGEISGKVGASQLAARKRESATGDFSVERKGIKFGSAFLQSEVGKADIDAFEARFKAMPDIAMKEFSLKLASYVSDGVIDAAQAASIADQVGIQFKNKVIGIKLQGQLQKLLTVDGKDLTKEPFEIRIQIAQETIDQFTNIAPNLQAQLDLVEKELKSNKFAAAFAAPPILNTGLAFTPEQNAKALEEYNKQVQAQNEALDGYNKAKEKIDEINAALKKYNAFAGAMASQAFESIQAQIDAIDVSTSKTIDKLKADKAATKDLAAQALIQKEIDRLETKKLESVKKLRNMNNQVTRGIEEQLKLATSGEKNQFFLASSEAIKTRFKGTKQEADASAFLDRSKAMGETTMRAKIEAVVSSGQFAPNQATQFLNLFGTDTENLDKTFNTYLTAQGLEDLDKLQSVLGDFADTDLAKEIIIKMGGLSDAEFQAQYSTLELLKQFDGEEINMEIALKKNPDLLSDITKLNSAVETIAMTPDTTFKTVEIALKNVVLEGEDPNFSEQGLKGLSDNWEYYKGLDPELRKTAIQTYISLFKTIFADKDSRMQWAANLAETASAGIKNEQARDQVKTLTYNTVIKSDGSFTEQGKKTLVADVQKQTEDIIGYMNMISKLTSGKGGGGGTGTRNTFLDSILDKLRRTRDASVDTTKGLEELRRVMKDSDGNIEVFNGLDQAISKLKAPQEFIDFIASLDPEGKKGGIESLATYLDTEKLKKGIVELTKDGKILLSVFREGVIGDFESDLRKATNGLIAQKEQFILLNLTVKDNKKSAEMLADANFALALSTATTTAEVERLVTAWEEADSAKKDYSATTTDPLEDLQNKFSEVEDKINKFFSLAQQEIEGRFARRIFDAEQEVKAAGKRVEEAQKNVANVQKDIDKIQTSIDAKQREIQESVTRPIEDFQEQIEDIEDIIKTNFDEPISILQEESSDLANDLTLLDKAADEVNKKYDAQEEALTKIAEINKDLIAQEKQRISLADALTAGDISAAAQAVQDMRQSKAEKVSSSNLDLVKAAREQEIANLRSASGQTRLEIEQRQFEITQAIYNLEEDREILEAKIALIKTRDILPLEKERERIAKLIRIDEDAILTITKDSLEPLKAKLAVEVEELEKLQEKLKIIEEEREAELTHLQSLKLKWTEIQGGIALAELATINLQTEIGKAIELAKLLAAEFAKIAVPGGGVPPPAFVANPNASPAANQEAADAAAAAADAQAEANAAADAATAAALAAADAVTALTVEADAISAATKNIARVAIVKATNTNSLNQAVALAQDTLSPESIAINMARSITKSESMTKAVGGTAAALSAARYTGQAMRYAAMGKSSGGMIKPKYFAVGGSARGTDIVPAMLTPGEFVMSKYAVDSYGVDKMKAINSGSYEGEKVYNYNLNVNVKSDANPDDIAKVVMTQIKQIDSQRIRTQRA